MFMSYIPHSHVKLLNFHLATFEHILLEWATDYNDFAVVIYKLSR